MPSLKPLAILLLLSPLGAQTTIYTHALILTGVHLLDPNPTIVSTIAVADGRILAIGPEAEKLRTPQTEVIDLHGAFVMPGFNDAHTHIAAAGQQKLTVDLDGTISLAAMQSRIAAYNAKAKPGTWIVGAGWDHTKWPSAVNGEKRLPTRQDLDQVTAGHPAVFYRTDGHILVANSAALLAAGISSSTQDPPGGKIDRDPTGTPTGIVREIPATRLIQSKVPPPDPETRRKALDLAIADALAHGVTSVQDFSDWDDWLVLESMEHRGQLNLRISEWLDFNLPVAVLKQRRASHDPDDPLLHLGFLKAFMDGSLGSRTAALAESYTDDPPNRGIPRYEQDKLNQLAAERAAAGFQLGFHAIGDEANTVALNAFSAAEQVAVPNSATSKVSSFAEGGGSASYLRFRIEHAQVLLPADFDRFAQLGVIASMQPSHLLTDMAWAGQRLGPERSPYAYAWRSMLDHHIPLAFGTDYPVESISPFRGLYSAITRQNETGTQTFHPEQRLTLAEALYAYTQTSAYAEFRETQKGILAPGFLADFIVLDRNLLTATPQQILHTKVLRTVVAGRTVYQAPPSFSQRHRA